LPKGDIILENEYLKAHFDTGSGQMISLWNKQDNEEMLSAPAGLHLVRTANDGMSAWRIGRYLQILPVNDTVKVWIKEGKLRKQAIFEQRVMHSTVRMTVSLDQGAKALAYDLEVDWHETCAAQKEIPVLSYRLPLKKAGDTIICDVPAGCAVRKEKQMDVPALTGVYPDVSGNRAALITDCKYGYRMADGVLSVTLINTAGDPDPYPERGIHAIRLYVALTDGHAAAFKALSRQLNRGMIAVPTARHEGKLPPQMSLMQLWASHCVLSGVEMKEDALVLRLYEAEGKKAMVTLQAPFMPKKALLTRLDGTSIAEAALAGDMISFEMAPYTIAQLQLEK
jgi:alpha-mannosidase